MFTYADKSTQEQKQENPVAASARSALQRPAYYFQDRRPQAIVQQKQLRTGKQFTYSSAALQTVTGKSGYYLEDNRPQAVIQKKQSDAIAGRQAAGQRKTNTTGLPDQLKSGIENLSGHSMDDVKVHYNSSKPAQLQAHAYAQGIDIHIASGQEKHLPHEAWHVVQQKQGRVKPTMQLKGKVNVNDDEALEKEADVMGAKALSGATVTQHKSFSSIPVQKPIVQGVFKMLSEENIIVLMHAAQQKGDTLDAQYLQGLYVKQSDKEYLDELPNPMEEEYNEEEDEDYEEEEEQYDDEEYNYEDYDDEEAEPQEDQGSVEMGGMEEEHNDNDDEEIGGNDLMEEDEAEEDDEEEVRIPEFFIKVGSINLSYFTGQPALGKTTRLFARADALSNAEAQQGQQVNQGNVLQILANHTEYWSQQEAGPKTAAEIRANTIAFHTTLNNGQPNQVGLDEGNAVLTRIVSSMLTGGVQEEGEGSYGAIEFRFKAVAGELYLLDTLPVVPAHFSKYPNLTIHRVNQANIDESALAYRAADFPYQDTRVKPDFVFVEQSLLPEFTQALQQQQAQQAVVRRNPFQALADPINNDGLFAPPLNAKARNKQYTFRATRGGRDAGQKAVMGNMSARDYVARFSPQEADEHDWEWLHLQGSRLSGPNRPENLVAGTAAANTHMIPYERAIFRLSGLATHQYPVNVNWSATVRQNNGHDTHIGDQITITVNFPNGPPPGADAKDVALFANPVVFSASEGVSFTKLDRDILDA